MKRFWVGLLVHGLLLSACSAGPAGDKSPSNGARPTRTPVPTATVASSTAVPSASLARTDAQGAVEFVIEPLNLNDDGGTIDFAVTMNTHAVDLGWDLAALSTLESDVGRRVAAIGWPIGSGHHYGGTLSFPRAATDGEDILAGAGVLRLTIRDTDVPQRVFTWDVAP